MRKNLVSLVLTSFNRKADADQTLASAFAQSYKPVEVIVVDNHSSDGTVEMVRKKYPKAALVVMPNSSYGACETFNIGFRKARGEFIGILDDDVKFERDWVRKLVAKFRMKGEERTGLLATRIMTPSGPDFSVLSGDKEKVVANFIGCGAMARAKALSQTELYPEEFFLVNNERDLALQLINKGWKVKYFPGVTTFHKASYRTRMTPRTVYFSMRNSVWLAWKFYPPHLAVWKTLRPVCYWSLYSLVHWSFIPFVAKGIWDAIAGMPHALRKRQVCRAPEMSVLQ